MQARACWGWAWWALFRTVIPLVGVLKGCSSSRPKVGVLIGHLFFGGFVLFVLLCVFSAPGGVLLRSEKEGLLQVLGMKHILWGRLNSGSVGGSNQQQGCRPKTDPSHQNPVEGKREQKTKSRSPTNH